MAKKRPVGDATLFFVILWTIGLSLLAVHPLITVAWAAFWLWRFRCRPNWWKKEQD